MGIKEIIRKPGFYKWITGGLIIVFLGLFIFRDKIMENKFTKAKLEMMKRMMTEEPKDWPEEMINVYDSLILSQDTTEQEIIK